MSGLNMAEAPHCLPFARGFGRASAHMMKERERQWRRGERKGVLGKPGMNARNIVFGSILQKELF